MTLFINEKEVLELMSVQETVAILEPAIKEQGLEEATNCARQIVRTDKASLSVLQAAVPSVESMGFKTYTVSSQGARFWLMLFNNDGILQALMEAENIGLLRTAAASGIATRHLSREDSQKVGLLGTGFQAASQLEALVAVRPIKEVKVWSRTRENVLAFCERMSNQLNLPVEPADNAHDAIKDADIITTITSAKDPIMSGASVKEGTHINLVGAMKPDFREVDTSTVVRANVLCVDDWEQAQEEAGELINAHKEGVLDWGGVKELSHIVAHGLDSPRTPTDITVFKSLGIGLWDVATAAELYKRAIRNKTGIVLPIEQEPVILGGGRDPDRIRLAI